MLCLIAAVAGCQSTGPRTIAHDRIDYGMAIDASWRRQTLLSIVKLRYLETPTFMDVGQVVAGYTLETSVSAEGQLAKTDAGDTFAGIGGKAVFTDRPTITYTPLTGSKFVKSLMMPVLPESVFFTIDSGWPADAVLFASLRSINGLKNHESTIEGTVHADANMLRAIVLFRKIQIAGGLAMRIQVDAQKQTTAFLSIRTQDISPEADKDGDELRRLLRLDPDAEEYKLIYGARANSNKEIAVLTRSVLHLMQTMSGQVDVPEQHLAEHRTPPGWESATKPDGAKRMVSIHCSKTSPQNAYVAVPYRDYWFWIDDRDLKSKRAFAFVMVMFTLSSSGEKEPMPLITIPAQ